TILWLTYPCRRDLTRLDPADLGARGRAPAAGQPAAGEADPRRLRRGLRLPPRAQLPRAARAQRARRDLPPHGREPFDGPPALDGQPTAALPRGARPGGAGRRLAGPQALPRLPDARGQARGGAQPRLPGRVAAAEDRAPRHGRRRPALRGALGARGGRVVTRVERAPRKRWRPWALVAAAAVLVAAPVAAVLVTQARRPAAVTYSAFLGQLRSGNVASVTARDRTLAVTLERPAAVATVRGGERELE